MLVFDSVEKEEDLQVIFVLATCDSPSLKCDQRQNDNGFFPSFSSPFQASGRDGPDGGRCCHSFVQRPRRGPGSGEAQDDTIRWRARRRAFLRLPGSGTRSTEEKGGAPLKQLRYFNCPSLSLATRGGIGPAVFWPSHRR